MIEKGKKIGIDEVIKHIEIIDKSLKVSHIKHVVLLFSDLCLIV